MTPSLDFMFHDSSIIAFIENDKPWFIASSITSALGYKDTPHAVRAHCDHPRLLSGEEQTAILGKIVANRGLLALDEGDAYRLILKSKLPEAREFERWFVMKFSPRSEKQVCTQ